MMNSSFAPLVALVVEDDPHVSRALVKYFDRRGNHAIAANSIEQARERLREVPDLDVVLADIGLPDGNGFELADELALSRPTLPVVIMSGDTDARTVIRAMHHKATGFLLKPIDFEGLDAELLRAVPGRRRPTQPMPMSTNEWRSRHAPGVVGNAPLLERMFRILERVANTTSTVLITGESGTGKELVARALHSGSNRCSGPFVPVNCAALPDHLVESELFGHTRGAFTGANNARDGHFAAADGGTIFLDEVGELPMPVQAKLLRVLQQHEVMPVGDSRARQVDVRVVAATNRDLETMVARGTFREDLWYRLNVVPIETPSLRDHREDIPAIVEQVVKQKNKKLGATVTGVSPEVMTALCAAEWPGNVRQLQNLIERMVAMRGQGTLKVDDLPPAMWHLVGGGGRQPVASPAAGLTPTLPDDGLDLREALEQVENMLIRQALERTNGNKNRAAMLLRINRTTLVEKLKKKPFVSDPDDDDVRDP